MKSTLKNRKAWLLFLLPVLLVYFLLNKGIISGMTAGAVKE